MTEKKEQMVGWIGLITWVLVTAAFVCNGGFLFLWYMHIPGKLYNIVGNGFLGILITMIVSLAWFVGFGIYIGVFFFSLTAAFRCDGEMGD